MVDDTERVLAALEAGRLSRREAVQRLVALAAVTFAGGSGVGTAAPGRSTVTSVGLNHVALRVTDLARSRDFYGTHLGMRVLRESDRTCFMAAGESHFVALFRADEAGLDHYCLTIDDYDAERVVKTLRDAGLAPARRQNRVYFDDPDGITLQLAGTRDDDSGEPQE